MESLRRKRLAEQGLALRPTGISERLHRIWSGQVTTTAGQADLQGLPPDTSRQAPLQNAAGVPYFMFDYDPLDGAPLA